MAPNVVQLVADEGHVSKAQVMFGRHGAREHVVVVRHGGAPTAKPLNWNDVLRGTVTALVVVPARVEGNRTTVGGPVELVLLYIWKSWLKVAHPGDVGKTQLEEGTLGSLGTPATSNTSPWGIPSA